MREYFPLLILFGVLGLLAVIFLVAYFTMKDKKTAIGFDRNMKDSEIAKRLLVYAKPHIPKFIFVGFLMLFSIAYDIIAPLIMGDILEIVQKDFALSELYIRVACYASILLISLVCTFVQALVLQKTGQKILSKLREDIFTHIESLSHAQLNNIPVGTLVTRVTNDTNAISMMFTNLLVNFVKNIFVIVGVLAAMLMVNYQLTLMVLAIVPFIALYSIIFRRFSRKVFRAVKDGTTGINTFLSENLSGMKIIQIFNREDRKMGEFEEKNNFLGKAKHKQIFVFGVFRPIIYMLYVATVLCILYLSGKGYIKGTTFLGQTIDVATLVTFYMYVSKFFNPIQSLAEQFNFLQSAFASAEKIFTVFDIKPDVVDEEDAIELDEVRGEIEFRDVWFSYVPDEWVLKGVSFKVNAKDTVAFVGSTGSGKTTILSLICRNYDIQKGEILIDGINIRHIKIASLRRHFGQMLQDVFLFAGTIRSNIALREEKFTDEEILAYLAGNLCRCSGYEGQLRGIRAYLNSRKA